MISRKVLSDNTIIYLKNGVLHREDGPAVVHSDGISEYWFEGRRHRHKGSAIIDYYSPAIKIKNGKVDPTYYSDDHYNEDGPILMFNTNMKEIVLPYLKRTFNVIQNTRLEDLGLTHREQIDSREKDTVKIYFNCMAHSVIGPADIKSNGTQAYYMYGVKHCEYGPAIVDVVKNTKYWYVYGLLHREDGPAIIRPSINKNNTINEWYRYGVSHRFDGPSFVEYNNKDDEIYYYVWMKDGKIHRSELDGQGNGPAIHMIKKYYQNEYYEGYEFSCWYLNGVVERWNGPAHELFGVKKWFLNGREMDEKIFTKTLNLVRKISIKFLKPLRRNLANEIYKVTDNNEVSKKAITRDISSLIAEYVM
jgi:hypothetical protein